MADTHTGRYLMVLSDDLLDDDTAAQAAVQELTGLADVTSSRDARSGVRPTLFSRLGVAVAELDPDRLRSARADRRVLGVEPERVQRALTGPGLSADYLRGFADAAAHRADRAAAAVADAAPAPARFADTDRLTWGLQATGVDVSPETGAGITVAVLDTGLDLGHPDVAGRQIESRSFVDGQQVQDAQGHGTHCVGTSCGPAGPAEGRRYGVAHGARILVGKVLGDDGSGTDAGILEGIEWAITSGAHVVSMSLGADLDEVSAAYENAGRRALDAGVLIVAAAGNNAERSAGNAGFVGVPANSPSIMAVGAVDAALAIADFSAASSSVEGGQVDIAGPGVDVYSAWPMPRRTNTISGTSMATPHVSGIAALWSQRTGARGRELWTQLTQAAQRLPLPSGDVGAGLVRAPGA
ncbi:putative subtilisin [Pseudonocardia sp. Ae168_Ps1]|uniref:S8 family serine peptidase n=1 Tax=unclassified Pseudonocardia TaxID=2619320 RepID=UPI00094B6AC7|nr:MULTISPECIES: S8 family serine peptidase [unclassified Pseudonocardia]OLL76912.1 putative subtilisin [Pseudonocardia sp. Ae150A_Ps1]OLL82928.1 putative subtilisin [Pseudonocardia sp. Ae168_Ps1]OLL82963.1 putative subtilisin [Pseudonocardia sp. Ae263_Ps1]OLL90999.1 putative subtilisin [Pseudonocardia sp. Ae356_Ps1]